MVRIFSPCARCCGVQTGHTLFCTPVVAESEVRILHLPSILVFTTLVQVLRTASTSKKITEGTLLEPTNTAINFAPNHTEQTSRILEKLLHFHSTIFPFDFIVIVCNDYQQRCAILSQRSLFLSQHPIVLRAPLLRWLTLLPSPFRPFTSLTPLHLPSVLPLTLLCPPFITRSTFYLLLCPSPLAPRPLTTSNASRKRLVPKKSKLGLLGAGKGDKERSQNDFSDVVQCIEGTTSAGQDGYKIYVDHTEDPDLEEIVLVKRRKSHVGLDAVTWGPDEGNMGNVLEPKPSANALKSKASEKENAFKPKLFTNILKPKRRARSGQNPSNISSQRSTRTRNGGVLVGGP